VVSLRKSLSGRGGDSNVVLVLFAHLNTTVSDLRMGSEEFVL